MKALTKKSRNLLAGVAGCVILLNAGTALAADPGDSSQADIRALTEEVRKLRTEVEAMHNELRALARRAGGQEQGPHRAKVGIAGGVTLGSADAPLTLVEFSDYQCPFCRRFHDQTFSQLKKEYIDTGKVRYVFRDFPLDRIHPHARKAAEAAHCVGDQGKYWEIHDVLFQNQQNLQPDDLKSYAKKLGLDMKAFETCFDEEKYASRVQQNLTDGLKIGVRGTPSFVLGKTGKDGTVDGLVITGARPFSDFKLGIDRLLDMK